MPTPSDDPYTLDTPQGRLHLPKGPSLFQDINDQYARTGDLTAYPGAVVDARAAMRDGSIANNPYYTPGGAPAGGTGVPPVAPTPSGGPGSPYFTALMTRGSIDTPPPSPAALASLSDSAYAGLSPTARAAIAPSAPNFSPYTSANGEISQRTPNVTVLTGDTARRYEAGAGYGPNPYAPPGSTGVPPVSSKVAPSTLPPPSGDYSYGSPTAANPYTITPANRTLVGPASIPSGGPGSIGTPYHAPRPSSADSAIINAAGMGQRLSPAQLTRLGQLGNRFGGTPDYFTPGAIETRNRMGVAAMNQQGEYDRQTRGFANQQYLEAQKSARERERDDLNLQRDLYKTTGEADPGAAGKSIRDKRAGEDRRNDLEERMKSLTLDNALSDMAFEKKNGMTKTQAFQKFLTDYQATSETRNNPSLTKDKGRKVKAEADKAELEAGDTPLAQPEIVQDPKSKAFFFRTSSKGKYMPLQVNPLAGVLTSGANESPATSSATPAPTSGAPAKPAYSAQQPPPVGTRGMYNGKPAVWNGKTFEPIK